MLSIAQYEDSDDDSEDGDDEAPTLSVSAKPSTEPSGNVADLADDELAPGRKTSLFASLPAPKAVTKPVLDVGLLLEPEDEVLTVPLADAASGQTKPPARSVKITVPSLAEFDEDAEATVKRRRIATGSSLVASLPPPKNSSTKTANRPLLPYTLSRKPAAPPAKSAVGPISAALPKPKSAAASTATVASSVGPSTKSIIGSAYDDSEDEDDDNNASSDFFSLDKVGKMDTVAEETQSTEASTEQISDSLPDSVGELATSSQSSLAPDYVEPDYNVPSSSSESAGYYSQVPSVDDPQALFQDAGFLRLRGKKRGKEDIHIIDVSQDDQLPNTEEWMTKSLSEETAYRPSSKNGNMPTSQQRRKHQITYLAFQAKERELELKNQWSQNRQTKYQTQSKYGF